MTAYPPACSLTLPALGKRASQDWVGLLAKCIKCLLTCCRDAAAPADYPIESGWCYHKVIERGQECHLHSEGPEHPHQIASALTFLVCSCNVISPVQFIVQVNTQILVRCHHLNVHSLDVHLCAGLSVPVEIHHQLFGLPGGWAGGGSAGTSPQNPWKVLCRLCCPCPWWSRRKQIQQRSFVDCSGVTDGRSLQCTGWTGKLQLVP